jgi:acylphosphatase
MTDARLTALVRGRVQGVGMREWVRRTATPLDLRGSAMNLPDGGVEVIAEGPRARCEVLLAALRGTGTPGRVSAVEAAWSAATGEPAGFVTGTR